MTNVKLFFINVVREDGKIWQKCVSEYSDSDCVVWAFEGPVDLVDKYFYMSNITWDGLGNISNDEITIVGNNKLW